jgi:hypothetical protein
MKKFENLGRMLSKNEQKRIRGGTEEEGPACKTSSAACSYITIGGHVLPGTCGGSITPPMQTAQCACNSGQLQQPASECNINPS